MILRRLNIVNFKNIASAVLEFSPKVNCFLGNNGMGKSNLLDAIYYLSFCKSFSGMTDRMLMKKGEDFAFLQADYLRKDIEEDLHMGMAKGKRKVLKRRGKEYERLSAHIGVFPLVLSSPQDIDLIRGTGEERRRFMDMVISQSDAVYLDSLIRYNKSLEQRNKLLRDRVNDYNLYLSIELMMEQAAEYIMKKRRQWVDSLTAIFNRYYQAIAGEGECVTLKYECSIPDGESFNDALNHARSRDQIIGHTTIGPHRDDMEMMIDDMPLRRVGSQGQCKTYIVALRLSQYDFLRDTTGMLPLLLLDDIFDKLDSTRVERIMKLVTGEGFGQIFVTDTNRTHLDEIMSHTQGEYKMWHVNSGDFTLVKQDNSTR